jgi:hypothetical protein
MRLIDTMLGAALVSLGTALGIAAPAVASEKIIVWLCRVTTGFLTAQDNQ